MSDPEIDKCIETNALQLSFNQKVSHYGFAFVFIFFALFFPALKTGVVYYGGEGVAWKYILCLSFISGLTGLILFFVQKDRLEFEIVKKPTDYKKLLKAVQEESDGNETWLVKAANNRYIVIQTLPEIFSGSWGELITIIFTDEATWVNAVADPSKRSYISTGRRTREITKLIVDIINHS